MTDLISYQLDDGIATLTLNNGKVNAISPAVIEAFNQALDRAEQDRAVVIVTGQPGILSGGYDLKVMTSGPQNAIALVAAGSTLARRMLAIPSRSSSPVPVTPSPRAPSCCSPPTTASASMVLPDRSERSGHRHDHAPCRHRTGTRSPAQIGVQPFGDQRRNVQPQDAAPLASSTRWWPRKRCSIPPAPPRSN
jgi:hypothetical protein